MSRQDDAAARAAKRTQLKIMQEKRDSRIKSIRHNAELEIREINIQYANDPERLRLLYEAEDARNAAKEKEKAAAEIKRSELIEKGILMPPEYTPEEEIFSAIVQGLGTCLAVAATVLLVVKAAVDGPRDLHAVYVTTFALVGASLFLMYVLSCLHHALVPYDVKELFDRLTNDAVYLVIASAYTAYALTVLHGMLGWVIFGLIWLFAVVGIVFYSTFGRKFSKAALISYLVMGWVALTLCTKLDEVLPTVSFVMLIICGVLYTFGLLFDLARKGKKWKHCVYNIIMLCASICLFFSIFFSF